MEVRCQAHVPAILDIQKDLPVPAQKDDGRTSEPVCTWLRDYTDWESNPFVQHV